MSGIAGISGSTRVFPVLAWPVEQVKAPTLFNAYFQSRAIDATLIPLKVPPEIFVQTVRTLMQISNVGGLFISIPHKPATLDAVDEATPRATLAQACNAVFRSDDGRIMGDLIDGEGFVRALDRTTANEPFDWRNGRALVVGCGGVGCAIAEALAQRGIAHIGLNDRDEELAQGLLKRLRIGFPGLMVTISLPEAKGYDLVVNSTPLGMNPGDPMPIFMDEIAKTCIVADCGMKIELTPLLQEALKRGCRIQKGKEMLLEQAPLYLSLFGWPGATSDDFRALEAL
jgi:shikimate dehydrogenase